MKIEKKDDKIILELDLFQNSYDAIGELIGKVPNLIGVVAGNKYSISQLCDLGYKDDQQEGNPIIMFSSQDELTEVCKEFNINIWHIPPCAYCDKPVRGVSEWGDKGLECFSCSEKNK